MPSLLDDTRELFDVLCTPSPQPDEQPDLFLQASDYMWKNRQSFPVTARLRVYALYKQGTVGDAPATGPPVWASVVDQAKYKQWAALRGTAVESARCSYVFAADELTQAAWRSPGEASVPLPDAPCGGETTDRSLRERIRALEAEVSRLTETSMRGWLGKWQPGSSSWLAILAGIGGVSDDASQWPRCYFVLRHGSLIQLRGEHDPTPRHSLALANCDVVDEGAKDGRQILSIWARGTLESARGPGAGSLLRVSVEEPEAEQWLSCLLNATQCAEPATEEAGEANKEAAPPASSESAPAARSPTPSSPLPRRAASAFASVFRRRRSTSRSWEIGSAGPAGRTEPEPPAAEPVSGPAAAEKSPPLGVARRLTPMKAPLDPYVFPASRPVHVAARPSILSGEAPQPEMRGMVNLVFCLVVVSNLRTVLQNAWEHGLLVQLPSLPSQPLASNWAPPLLRTAAVLILPICAAYAIERSAVRARTQRGLVDSIHGANCALALAVPCALVGAGRNLGGPSGGACLLFCSVTLFMKLISYAHVHHDLREADRESAAADGPADLDSLAKFDARLQNTEPHRANLHYPANVTLPNLLYFVVAPTLCYQPSFPRSPHVRWPYLLSLLLRLLALLALLLAILQQYLVPLLVDSVEPVVARDAAAVFDRLLKLAIPVTYVWIGGFCAVGGHFCVAKKFGWFTL